MLHIEGDIFIAQEFWWHNSVKLVGPSQLQVIHQVRTTEWAVARSLHEPESRQILFSLWEADLFLDWYSTCLTWYTCVSHLFREGRGPPFIIRGTLVLDGEGIGLLCPWSGHQRASPCGARPSSSQGRPLDLNVRLAKLLLSVAFRSITYPVSGLETFTCNTLLVSRFIVIEF